MIAEELDDWAVDFERFCARFADIFGRKEPRAQAAKYLRGLLATVPRKNGWQVAEVIGDRLPDATQRLLYQACWSADAARDRLLAYVLEVFGDADGIGIVDETGFLKQGEHSVGVQRQYSGTAGKIENCQIGTFLSYATVKGHVFLDRRLFLPEAWCRDRERRAQAQVPEDVVFQTKPEQAAEMLAHAWQLGVPMRWVAGDEIYGESPALRDFIARHERWYGLGVRTTHTVWTEPPPVSASGRSSAPGRLAAGATAALTVKAVVARWPASRWQRLTVAEGEKGLRIYDWGYQRGVEGRDGVPVRAAWLLARRSLSDPTDIAYFLSNAPADVALLKLAQVAATRYTVEQCVEEAKSDTGLDEYEVRYWHSWYRHITFSMLAHAWLAAVRWQATEKKGGPSPSWPT